ncbi:hippocampus abundant transcript 1 protein-like [Melia azedarach]|uniref:Hippocampus abundant transcript 1 protein-like n=1 Tax=Melia azedarach TaxID=155640 RepID=A0ACC1XXQ6_MELAZ|nr:hippocampus abundant transcript 1 protein-like [Melia azedarach]
MEKITALSHLFVTVSLWGFANMMVIPAITDVMMTALCPHQDACSLAIYLSGFQQAIVGLGTLVMMPLIGNLSDQYGRKAVLTLPMTLSIIPLAILAYSRTTSFFYAYYVLRTLTAMLCEGSVNCLALAYVADNISERQRASAFGILTGVLSASFVCGTLAARFLSPTSTFQVATFVSMLAAVYMRVFLKENIPDNDGLTQRMIKGEMADDVNQNESNNISLKKTAVGKKIPSLGDLIFMLKSSVTLTQAAVVAFFSSLSEGGLQASFLYFLKARFHFNKDQFADLMLIGGVAGAVSQLLFMPLIAPFIDERKLLSLGLFSACVNMFVCSISWSAWVPYATTACSVFVVFATPALRSITSKQVGANEQGKAQGCISGISSFANILSPLIFSPLTALFLSERAPFNFPGFSLMGIGLASMFAFIQSLAIRDVPRTSKSQNHGCLEP